MNQYDLTICLPSLCLNNLSLFHDSVLLSAKHYNVQLIIIGPRIPPLDVLQRNNVKFISDYGTPSRCIQIAAIIAEGKFITWASDDGLYTPNSLKNAIDMLSEKSEKDGVTMKFTESRGRRGPPPGDVILTDAYWKAWTHDGMKFPGIPKDYSIAPIGLYYTNTFKTMGGFNCKFVHANMNTHDLAFRIQKMGGILHLSQEFIIHFDFQFGPDRQHLIDAYYSNDEPLLKEMYSQETALDDMPLMIDIDNWRNSPVKWREFT